MPLKKYLKLSGMYFLKNSAFFVYSDFIYKTDSEAKNKILTNSTQKCRLGIA